MKPELFNKIYLLVNQICGLAHFTIDLKICLYLKIYSGFNILLFVVFFFENIFNVKFYVDNDQNTIQQVVNIIQSIGVRMCHIVNLVEAFYRSDKLLRLVIKLKQRSEEIEKNFGASILPFRVNGTMLCRKIVPLLFIYMLVLSVAILFIVLNERHHLIIMWIISTISITVTSLRYLQFYMTVTCVRNILEFCSTELKKSVPLKMNLLDTEDIEGKRETGGCDEQFTKIVEIIDNYYDFALGISNRASYIFGCSLLFNLANNFIACTANCFWFITRLSGHVGPIDRLISFFGNTIWSLPHLVSILLMTGTCHFTASAVSKSINFSCID